MGKSIEVPFLTHSVDVADRGRFTGLAITAWPYGRHCMVMAMVRLRLLWLLMVLAV